MLSVLISKIFAYSYSRYKNEKQKEYLRDLNLVDAEIRYPFKLLGSKYISIGKHFYCGSDSRIEAWDNYNAIEQQVFVPQIKIGDNVRINGKCHIGAINSICIGNNVLMGSSVFITDHEHGRSDLSEIEIAPTNRELYSKGPVIIQDNVWLCENVTVLPGVTIGAGSIIACGAVVTKSIPSHCIAGGIPAKVIKTLE